MEFNNMFYYHKYNAEAVALALRLADEDGWGYSIENSGSGWIIIVHDEYGNYLGFL